MRFSNTNLKLKTMEVRIWLSYDLGLKGDYPGMYAWLDNHNAVECGDGMASLLFECSSRKNVAEELKKSIAASVDIAPTDRIYCINRKEDNRTLGRFIFGKRKANPWEGYGSKGEEVVESEAE